MQARTVLAGLRVPLSPRAWHMLLISKRSLNEGVDVRVDSEVDREAGAMEMFVQMCHSQALD